LAKNEVSALERTLVLCVDRDDDLGSKAGIQTPLIGREENINAAVNLALKDPEEPDANAIFEAVRIYDRFIESNQDKEPRNECQIATIAGSELGDVGADKTLVAELIQVLNNFSASEVILVSDGFADEAILPLVQSRVPVSSVRRITVRHSESIEESMWLLSRYVKTLFENPRYSRIVLGLPGALLIILAALYMLNWIAYSWIAFLIVLGGFLVVKGFMLDKAARGLYVWIREYSPPPFPVLIASFAAMTGFLLVALGLYQGGFGASIFISTITPWPSQPAEWLPYLPSILGNFLTQSIMLIVIGVCVMLSGRAIRWFIERDNRLFRTIVIIAVVGWSSQIFYEASLILMTPALTYERLVFAIGIGIFLAIAFSFITLVLHRRYSSIFKDKETRIENDNQPS
jgi:putative membrane protein